MTANGYVLESATALKARIDEQNRISGTKSVVGAIIMISAILYVMFFLINFYVITHNLV